MRIAVMMIAVIGLLFSCGEQDKAASSNGAVRIGAVASADEDVQSNRVEQLNETTPADEAAPPSGVEHTGAATLADDAAPPNRTELGFRYYSPKMDMPAPLRLRIFEASAIVRASLMSSSAEAVSYSKAYGLDLDGDELTSFNEAINKLGLGDSSRPVGGEYRAAHTFRFRVSEYLKGSGA